MNPEILAISQDEKGEQAKLILQENGIWIYKKNLSDGSVAVAVFNTLKSEKKFDLKTTTLSLEGTYQLRDIWKHTDAGILKEKIELMVKGHEAVVLKLMKN